MASRPVAQRDLEAILTLTAPLWEQLRGRQLFLTGGTGFFGCWLLESFLYANRALSLGASVVALTRSPERFREKAPHLANDPAVHLLPGDIRSFTFPDGDFEYLIHAATDTGAQAAEQPAILLSSIRRTARAECCSSAPARYMARSLPRSRAFRKRILADPIG
jgi:dTDP-glucose 4,6-dehydratase